jgi:hypothetical protein
MGMNDIGGSTNGALVVIDACYVISWAATLFPHQRQDNHACRVTRIRQLDVNFPVALFTMDI